MNEKVDKFLRLLGIWAIVCFVFLLVSALVSRSFTDACFNFATFILSTSGFFIAFLPIILGAYFLFKKVNNKCFRIFFISFIIPFANLIYFFVEHFFMGGETVSMIIGFVSLVYALPTIFVLALVAPKSLLPIKWEVVITSLLTVVFGWMLVCVSLSASDLIDARIEKDKLIKYEVVIKDLDSYKKQKGLYPKKYEDKIGKFKYFDYEILNSGKDYTLTVGDGHSRRYNYCSNENLKNRFSKETWFVPNGKCGKWVVLVNVD